MTRKSRTFGQLLRYMAKPDLIGPPLLHNLRSASEDLDGIRREFFQNSLALRKRKNGNILFHEILSFGADDKERVTPAIVEAVTRHFLELRAPYALAYARAHFDTNCPHVHILISANTVGSSERFRLSQAEFQKVKEQLNEYVRSHFPELQHSISAGRQLAGKGVRRTRAEQERRRRGDFELSRKEQVRQNVAAELVVASSAQDCWQRLLSFGLRLYRRGKNVGVVDESTGRRYRLRTLGLAAAFARSQKQWRQLATDIDLPPPAARIREWSKGIER